jgi:hypothetical protein
MTRLTPDFNNISVKSPRAGPHIQTYESIRIDPEYIKRPRQLQRPATRQIRQGARFYFIIRGNILADLAHMNTVDQNQAGIDRRRRAISRRIKFSGNKFRIQPHECDFKAAETKKQKIIYFFLLSVHGCVYNHHILLLKLSETFDMVQTANHRGSFCILFHKFYLLLPFCFFFAVIHNKKQERSIKKYYFYKLFAGGKLYAFSFRLFIKFASL